ncbi:MAG: hypothetical protein ACPGLY_07715 [Rubripirellula sp.]
MFINPMWDHESQRVGKQKCTPVGYMLHGISDLIGFIAIICLLGVIIYLAYACIRGEFTIGTRRYLLIPFTLAIPGNVLHSYYWYLADMRHFKYDYGKSTSTWVDESGVQ